MASVTIEQKLLDKQTSRNIIRAKLVELGLAESTAKLDSLATIIEGITNQGAISLQIREGETVTIPKGYHNGSGTVSGVSGGGDYKLEPTKTVTPTKYQQNITPSSGFYGIEGVTVEAIPNIYQDVSSVNAVASDVLSGKIIVLADGSVIAGTMIDNETVTTTLSATTVSYTIPKGFHSGNGKVTITLEEKNVTPSKSEQIVTPTSGKVLSKLIVSPIPDEYIITEDATAEAGDVAAGEIVYVKGIRIEGTMPLNGTIEKTLNGITSTSVAIPAGKTDGGTVTFDDSKIVEMLDAI